MKYCPYETEGKNISIYQYSFLPFVEVLGIESEDDSWKIKEHTKNPLYLLFYKYSGFLNYFVQWNLPLFSVFYR